MQYYLQLGNTKELSLLEIKSLYTGKIAHILDQVVAIKATESKALKLFSSLGGITKAEVVELESNEDSLIDALTNIIKKSNSKNVAITSHANKHLSTSDLKNIKTKVSKTQPIRLLKMHDKGTSLVPLKKKHALELSIYEIEGKLTITKTVFIHDFKGWKDRDRNKPYRNIKRGMMPPKLARIMLNIASEGKTIKIADPSCGTGTIALEALMLGHTIIASDISKEAVIGTSNNIEWLITKYSLSKPNYSLGLIDATQLHKHYSAIDAVVTEPFMGPLINEKNADQQFSRDKIKRIVTGLDKLYKGSLKSWHKVLEEKGRVVMIVPEFHIHNSTYSIPIIDACENLGYNMVAQIDYSKPRATLIRKIIILEKNVKN